LIVIDDAAFAATLLLLLMSLLSPFSSLLAFQLRRHSFLLRRFDYFFAFA